MKPTTPNGKGSRPRPANGPVFRSNFDYIFRRAKQARKANRLPLETFSDGIPTRKP